MREQSIKAFTAGVHNLIDAEVIPADAASYSLGWTTADGRLELMRGRQLVGAQGAVGKVYTQHTAYKADGTEVEFRKIATKVQVNIAGTWTDVITGLTAGDVTFANYQSLAGAFVYVFSLNGLYKIAVANPTNYADQYLSTKNFKGYGLIDTGRTFLWGRATDPTGLYGSYIDAQDSTVYTTVTGEAVVAVESGTLAFKAGGARRTCFAVVITDTSSGEVFTDNYNGVLVGSISGTGTINYMTGAFTITGQTGAGTATYQWEDATAKGVMDFSKTATRLAGEGFVLRQDAGGDAIRTVLVHDGAYFSLKATSCYKLVMDAADTDPSNTVFRTDIGVKSLNSASATGKGILFVNTANPTKSKVSIIQRNPLGDNFDAIDLFPHFKFEDYEYADAVTFNWDKFLLIACREDSDNNNRILLCNVLDNSVSIAPYDARAFNTVGGLLHSGSALTETSHEVFTGFDDLTNTVINSWESKAESFGGDTLKKIKRLRFKGLISTAQSCSVYIEQDNLGYTKVGTILGAGSYVNALQGVTIGTTMLGTQVIGGESTVEVGKFLVEIKIRLGKFRVRKIKLIAEGLGYIAFEKLTDFDIWLYQDKLPVGNRIKQNVSLDGETTNLSEPQ